LDWHSIPLLLGTGDELLACLWDSHLGMILPFCASSSSPVPYSTLLHGKLQGRDCFLRPVSLLNAKPSILELLTGSLAHIFESTRRYRRYHLDLRSRRAVRTRETTAR
jgi:hypothetical protein